MDLLNDGSILANYGFNPSGPVRFGGEAHYTTSYQQDTITGGRNVSVKYASNGEFEWLYMLDALNGNRGSAVSALTQVDDTLELIQRFGNGSLTLGDEYFPYIEFGQVFIELNADTGELIDGHVIDVEQDEEDLQFHICSYIDKNLDGNTERFLYDFHRYNTTVFGEEWLETGQSAVFFIELNGDLLSSVIETSSADVFTYYPNPAQSNSLLTIELADQVSTDGQVTLYDAKGRLINIELVSTTNNELQVQLPGLDNGVYVISYTIGDRTQSKLLMIN
jgi:hypothetical protein